MADSTPTQAENPLVHQRMLLSELKRIRESKSFLQKQVAAALDWSVSKVIRIENGAVGISKSDLIALLHHYGVTDQERVDKLLDMARISRQSAWWDKYKDQFSTQFINFVAFEASSHLIRQFHALSIPGLLQTRDYARSIISLYDASAEYISLGIDVRLERQQRVMEQARPPEMFFILDEAVIRRWVGGPDVMREQLNRLKELNRRPGISIQIARFKTGAYVGMKGSFAVFEFPAENDFAVLLEYTHQDVLLQNNAEETSKFLETFFELEDLAEPSSKTDEIIDEVLATLPGGEPDKKKGAAATAKS